MSKEQLEENQQEDFTRELAKRLGVKYEELIELEYEIHENTSDDGLVYGEYVEFKKDVNPEILRKIKGLNEHFTVYI